LALSLTVRGVEAGYGAVRALHGVSLDIQDTETVALLGTNGNGKSTLMKCVMGMVRPTRGSIVLQLDGAEHDLTRLSTEQIMNLGVAMVPEGRRLFPKLTVAENLLLGAFRPAARGAIAKNLEFAYEIFPALGRLRRREAGYLSGGERQMLAIGSALACAPRLLLVDELSQGLAPLLVEEMMRRLETVRAETGATILLVEQNAQVALEVADYGYVMENGRIVLDGTPERLRAHQDIREFYLGAGGGERRRSYREVKQYRRSRRDRGPWCRHRPLPWGPPPFRGASSLSRRGPCLRPSSGR